MGNYSRRIIIERSVLEDLVRRKLRFSQMSAETGYSRDVLMRNMREQGIDFSDCVVCNHTYKFAMDKEEMQKYLDMHMTYKEIAEVWKDQTGEVVPDYVVSAKGRSYGLKSEGNRYYMRRDNPAKRDEVKAKISESVSKLWQSGNYADRINGMTGVIEENHPGFKMEGPSSAYLQKARFYHPEAICLCCGKQLSWESQNSDEDIEVHHVDHDHSNYTLTNLMPLCRECHKMYHKNNQFFTTVTKLFSFDAAHYLPYHDGKCKFIHGHTYHMEVTVRNVIRLDTGMVMDFSQLKEAVKDNVLDKFDHGFLNEYLPYSTCECMIFWIWRELSKDIKGLHKIKLQETDGSYAELTVEDYKQCMPQFESAWHYSKGIDGYYIDENAIIDGGHSSYPVAEFLCAHNKDTEMWAEYDKREQELLKKEELDESDTN